eukprot:1183005-Prorocentrum_minimum.AAC.3
MSVSSPKQAGGAGGCWCARTKLYSYASYCRAEKTVRDVANVVQTKKYWISFNYKFDEVVSGCVRQHGENWLYLPLRNGAQRPNVTECDRTGSSSRCATMRGTRM